MAGVQVGGQAESEELTVLDAVCQGGDEIKAVAGKLGGAPGGQRGPGSRVPQPSGSAPANASGALAMPQHLWHRTATSAAAAITHNIVRIRALRPRQQHAR
jgi:hypothetical protein